MEQYKLDAFAFDHPEKLDIWTLDNHLSNVIISGLFKTLDIDIKNAHPFKEVYDKLGNSLIIDSINEKEGFDVLFSKIFISQLNDEDQVFLIWNINTPVDICSVKILKKYWDYIWYGSSDEALLLFVPEKFVLQLSDWGEVKYDDFHK